MGAKRLIQSTSWPRAFGPVRRLLRAQRRLQAITEAFRLGILPDPADQAQTDA
jgi:hypothetical protein